MGTSANTNEQDSSPGIYEGLPLQVHTEHHPQGRTTLLAGIKAGTNLEVLANSVNLTRVLTLATHAKNIWHLTMEIFRNRGQVLFFSSLTPLASALTRPYQFVRFYQFLINASIVTRWTLFIAPILIIVWIPGILVLAVSPNGEVGSS